MKSGAMDYLVGYSSPNCSCSKVCVTQDQGSRIGVFCDCLQMRVLIGIIAQDTTLPVIMVNRRTVDPGLLLVDGRGRSIDLMMYEELG